VWRTRLGNVSASSNQFRLECLLKQPARSTRRYLNAVYGHNLPDHSVRDWDWRHVDVIWLSALDVLVRTCLMESVTPGRWAAHEAQGFFLPPIGSKMEYPVIWQYRAEMGCAQEEANWGGARLRPYAINRSWVEVFHYYGYGKGLDTPHLWLYQARGSGVYYRPGRTLVFSDHADLVTYLERVHQERVSVNSKDRLISTASRLLSREYDTIAFSHHVDSGYAFRTHCVEPAAGWDPVYYHLYELVAIAPRTAKPKDCPPEPSMRGGWNASRECECDPQMLRAEWPSLPKDRTWQFPVVRCNVDRFGMSRR